MIKKINLICPANNLSYGYVGQNLIKAFIKNGFHVNLETIGPIEIDTKAGYDEYIDKCGNELDKDCPTIVLWHHFDLKRFAGAPGSLRIGFPIFETNVFSLNDLQNLNSMDRLFVTCDWYKDILVKNGYLKRIDCVPLGVDPDIFKPNQVTRNDDIVRFLNIGKWEIRKGHDLLIRAFGQEFSGEKVSLTLVCQNMFLGNDNFKWIEYAKKHIPEKQLNILNTKLESAVDVATLINQHDVYISSSKAEGWDLPLLEALACDLPSIATNTSGHTAFCTKQNSYLIDCPETEPMFDGTWFMGQGLWAKLDIETLRQKMRDVYVDLTIPFRYNAAPNEVASSVSSFTWENTINAMGLNET